MLIMADPYTSKAAMLSECLRILVTTWDVEDESLSSASMAAEGLETSKPV